MTPGRGSVPEPGLSGNGAGHGSDHDGAGFGLPPGIDDGTTLLADHLVIPFPGRGIDGLADGAEKAQARHIVRIGPLIALADEGAYGGGGGIEDVDAVFFDEAPEAVGLGEIGRAFVHHSGGAGGERAVQNIAVSGDPADIGGAPVGVFLVQVEDPLHGHVGLQEISGGGVDDAFGLAGGAGGVEHVEGMLAVQLFGGTDFTDTLIEIVPPVVAAFQHGNGAAGAFVDDDVADGRAIDERFVHGVFEADFLAAAPGAVAGDDDLGFEVLYAGFESFGGEATEDHAVGDAEAGAGKQGDGKFGDHAHVDDGAVAGLEAAGFEDVGEAADEAVQLLVGDHALVAGLAFPKNGGLVFPCGREVAVDAIIGGVDFAAGEPLGEGRVPLEDVGPLVKPVELLRRELAPELLGLCGGSLIEGAIALDALHVRLLHEFRGRRVDVCVGHARILSECDYGTSRKLAAAHGFEKGRCFVERVSVDVRAQMALAGKGEDGGEIVARAEVAAADSDAFEDGIDQGKFVGGDRQADQDERAVAAQGAEGLRNGGWGGGEDNGGIHAARRRRVGAGGVSEREFFRGGIGHEGAQSLMEGELECQVAEAAEAEEGDGLAGGECSFAESSVGGPAGAAERGCISGRQFERNAHEGGGGSHGVIAKRALEGVAEVGLFGTEALAAGDAPLAGSTGGAQKGDARAVAGGPIVNAGADRLDAADAFVTEGEGDEGKLLQACDEEVGVAESTGFHAEENFAGGGFGEVERFDGDGSPGVGQDGGSGVGAAHAEEYNEIRREALASTRRRTTLRRERADAIPPQAASLPHSLAGGSAFGGYASGPDKG